MPRVGLRAFHEQNRGRCSLESLDALQANCNLNDKIGISGSP